MPTITKSGVKALIAAYNALDLIIARERGNISRCANFHTFGAVNVGVKLGNFWRSHTA